MEGPVVVGRGAGGSSWLVLALLLSLAGPAGGVPETLYVCAPNTARVCTREPGGIRKLTSVGANAPHGLMVSPTLYHFGFFSVRMKFQAGYTGGILTAFYLIDRVTTSNKDPRHAEIDMEFYGGPTPGKIILGMNVFAGGKNNLMQVKLPYDGSKRFYEYGILWNSRSIVWFVDGVPYRVLNRRPDHPWPDRPLQPTLSVWDTSAWSALKANYQNGPISSLVYDMKNLGCPAPPTAVQAFCTTSQSPVWNRVLPPAQLLAYKRIKEEILIKEFGWKSSV